MKKCVNYVIIILIQNNAFDTTNTGKKNIRGVLLIGAVEYETICFFYF